MNSLFRLRLWLVAVAAFASGAHVLGEPAFQYHCAGGGQLAAEARLASLRKVLDVPATANFENILLGKISRTLTNRFRLGNNADASNLIRPLLRDLVEKESLGSFGGMDGDGTEFLLALPLESSRTQIWQDTLAKVFNGAGESFSIQDFSGLRWKSAGAKAFWLLPAKDWLLAGCGDEFSAERDEYLGKIKSRGRPAASLAQNWLEADVVSARMGGWLRLLKAARINLTIGVNENNIQVNARISEAEAVPWTSGQWRIPKELVRGQVIAFTAGQDLGAFFNLTPTVAKLPSSPLTNQFFFWALDQMPLLNYMAWPVANASNALRQISTEVPPVLNPILKRFNGSELNWNPKAVRLGWMNMQLFVPGLEAIKTADGDFLYLSSFPRTANPKPLSDALRSQIESHTNLVYYDWELTGNRLAELEILGRMVSNHAEGENSDVENSGFIETMWLNSLVPALGNTVTEVTRVSPTELSVERKAPIGLTAVELLLLADWCCDANAGPIQSKRTGTGMPPFMNHP